jgi:hypothetical protein
MFGCSGVLERPWGVTLLGAWFAVNGVFQFMMFVLLPSGAWGPIPLLLSVVSFVEAFGLLLGEGWVWRLTFAVEIAYLALGMLILVFLRSVNGLGLLFLFIYVLPAYPWLLSVLQGIGVTPFHPRPVYYDMLGILVPFVLLPMITIIYLMLPHVKKHFLGRPQ